MKINVTNLTPSAEEVIVTGKIGDLSVRQFIKKHNLVDEIVSMRHSDFNDKEVLEVLVDTIPEGISLEDATKRAKEILEVTREEVEAKVLEDNESIFEFNQEKKLAKESL